MNINLLNLIPLPIELQIYILEYANHFYKLRNGQFMKQLPKKCLKKMNKKINKMPKKTNGYTILQISNTTTEIIIGPSFYYVNVLNRL